MKLGRIGPLMLLGGSLAAQEIAWTAGTNRDGRLYINPALTQDIAFTNKVATITNLAGRVYTNIALLKANKDGLVYSGDGMGLIPYTTLDPALLESLGVSTNRIWIAAFRAEWAARRAAMERGIATGLVNKTGPNSVGESPARGPDAENRPHGNAAMDFFADVLRGSAAGSAESARLASERRNAFNAQEQAAWNEEVMKHARGKDRD